MEKESIYITDEIKNAGLSLHYIGLLNIDNTTSVSREKMYLVFLFMSAACVLCVFSRFILDTKFVGRTSRGHTGGRSHRISHPSSFCGACLNFSREKESAIPFPPRP